MKSWAQHQLPRHSHWLQSRGHRAYPDWLWFDDNQALTLDYDNGMVSLLGAQSFNLSSQNGANSLLEIIGLDLNLNDLSDRLLGGTMDYTLDGATTDTFTFGNINMSPFNSSSYDGTNLQVYAWGGDEQNNVGIDFVFAGEAGSVPPTSAPVPGTMILVLLGLAGIRSRQRRLARTAK